MKEQYLAIYLTENMRDVGLEPGTPRIYTEVFFCEKDENPRERAEFIRKDIQKQNSNVSVSTTTCLSKLFKLNLRRLEEVSLE